MKERHTREVTAKSIEARDQTELGRIGGGNEEDRNRLRCQKGRNALLEVPITAPLIPEIEIANDVHKSGTRLDAIVIGNARFVPSRRKLGSFFEPDLLKK
jgi:hypothetical protein